MDGINLKNVPNQQHNPRSSFDLSFKRMFDFQFGQLIPVMCLPIIPDDEMFCSYQFLNRMSPFISQVFQDYKIKFDFYFVPNQLIYNNFELFMSAGYDGNQTFIHPYLKSDSIADIGSVGGSTGNFLHTIFDYLDITQNFWFANKTTLLNEPLNAIPFFALIQCYLDYFIGTDTSLQKLHQQIMSREYMVRDGDNTLEFYRLMGAIQSGNPDWQIPSGDWHVAPDVFFAPFRCLYPLDYFTSCRSNAQLGPVMTIPVELVSSDLDGTNTFKLLNSSSSSGTNPVYATYSNGSSKIDVHVTSGDNINNRVTVNGQIFNNVATINDFYSAARIQELLTLYNYSGFSPAERLSAEFGVKNPDSRMHKAEWLHSSIHDASVGEVFSSNVNDSATSGNIDIPGTGTAVSATNSGDRGFKSYFTQYGYVIGFMSVFPEASYFQGLPRHFSIKDRFDYPHFLLSEIGMADVKVKELYADAFNANHWNDTFAYMSQYGDSKVGLNRVNGNIRGNLNFMNAGRQLNYNHTSNFSPVFNDKFLQVDPAYNNLDRTFNVLGYYPHDCPLLAKIDFNIKMNRQLPYYGLPRF